MKSIIRSAKPYWIYLILTGKKKVEVGKDCPKSKDWNRIVEMYCSKDMRSFKRIPEKDRAWMRKCLGKVACRFVCLRLEKFTVGSLRCDDIEELSCLSYSEMIAYFYKPEELDGKTAKEGYGWHIDNLKVYDAPKGLCEFTRACVRKDEDCSKCKHYSYFLDFCDGHCNWRDRDFDRPPQNWCYCEA